MLNMSMVISSALVCAAGIISPGPNFVAVSYKAIVASRVEAMVFVFGVALVSSLWAAAALFGIRMIFLIFPWLFWIIKLSGAIYLMWFGCRFLRNATQPLPEKISTSTRAGILNAWKEGVFTNISNPKSMAFYASVFSTSVPSHASLSVLVSMVCIVFSMSGIWYGGVALLLSSSKIATIYRRGKSNIERFCGVILIAFGLKQLFSR